MEIFIKRFITLYHSWFKSLYLLAMSNVGFRWNGCGILFNIYSCLIFFYIKSAIQSSILSIFELKVCSKYLLGTLLIQDIRNLGAWISKSNLQNWTFFLGVLSITKYQISYSIILTSCIDVHTHGHDSPYSKLIGFFFLSYM